MKYLLLLLLAISANAGLFTTVDTWNDLEVKPDKRFTVNTSGLNPRVYVFTVPNSKPTMQCIQSYVESKYKAPVMFCWPKGK